MTTREEFVNLWENKWVKLSYYEVGNNQMNVTEYQVVTKLTFMGADVRLNGNSFTRSGHPSEEDAANYGLQFIGYKQWTRDTIRLDLKLNEEEVYDYNSDTSTKEWKLMRETGQAVEIELFVIETIDSSIVMPSPKYSGIKF